MNPTYGTPIESLHDRALASWFTEVKIEVAEPSPGSVICYTATTPTKWARSTANCENRNP